MLCQSFGHCVSLRVIGRRARTVAVAVERFGHVPASTKCAQTIHADRWTPAWQCTTVFMPPARAPEMNERQRRSSAVVMLRAVLRPTSSR